MKHLRQLYSGLLILCSLLLVPGIAQAASISSVQITELEAGAVVVAWQTDVPATSQVAYNDAFNSYLTPQYSTPTLLHEVIITDLAPGVDYTFYAISVTEDGTALNTTPYPYTLTRRTSGELGNIEEGTAATYLVNTRTQLTNLFRDLYRYSKSQEGTVLWLSLAVVLAGVVLFFENISLPLLFEWVIVGAVMRLGRKRKHSTSFTIYNSFSNQPVAHAQVTVAYQVNGVTKEQNTTSNAYGKVFFTWPADKEVTVTVRKKGFHTVTKTLQYELFDIGLEPVFPFYREAPHAFSFLFPLLHSEQALQRIALLLGSVLLAFSISTSPTVNGLVFITCIIYVVLWALVLAKRKQRYVAVQVVNTITHIPVMHAIAHFHTSHGRGRAVTNKQGILQIPYPLPARISMYKRGYVTINNVEVQASDEQTPIRLQLMPKEA